MKKFRVIYSKKLNQLFILLNVSKHKGLEINFQPLCLFSKYSGCINLGVNFEYRTKKVHHKGFTLILDLIFFKCQIDFSDDRHLEYY